MSELLVSVRSAEEARIALDGGAALIDIKEPSRGALGRADERVIHEVLATVDGSCPVSAAMGEWTEKASDAADSRLAFIKWGLAGSADKPEWRNVFDKRVRRTGTPRCVLVAYADWQCAQAPSVEDVVQLARDHPGSVMLVDTHCKDAANNKARPTLLDWLPAAWIVDLCARCRDAHIRIALAGSLGVTEIRTLLPARPDWFAVRGAACGGDRHDTVQLDRVRELKQLLHAS